MSARRDDPDALHPFVLSTWANNMLAGMAARHAPATDEREVEPNHTEEEQWHAEYEEFLDATQTERE